MRMRMAALASTALITTLVLAGCGQNNDPGGMPGMDHAGIATQTQVEKKIAKEGKNAKGHPLTRHDLGRARFLERTWKWKDDHHAGITGQLRRMGSSLDWKRERFTMDEGLSEAVREARQHAESSVHAAVRAGRLLIEAKAALPHGEGRRYASGDPTLTAVRQAPSPMRRSRSTGPSGGNRL